MFRLSTLTVLLSDMVVGLDSIRPSSNESASIICSMRRYHPTLGIEWKDEPQESATGKKNFFFLFFSGKLC